MYSSLAPKPSHCPVFSRLDSDQKLDGGKAWTMIKNWTVGRLGQWSKTRQWEGLAWTVIKNSTVERLGLDSDQKLDSGKAWLGQWSKTGQWKGLDSDQKLDGGKAGNEAMYTVLACSMSGSCLSYDNQPHWWLHKAKCTVLACSTPWEVTQESHCEHCLACEITRWLNPRIFNLFTCLWRVSDDRQGLHRSSLGERFSN